VIARVEIAAPREDVYRAFTEGPSLERWITERATTRPVEGGELWLGFETADGAKVAARGVFLALLPGERASYRMVYPPEIGLVAGVALSQVVVHETDVVLEERERGRVAVTVTDRIDASAPPAYVHAAQALWQNALRNLESVLEGGPDLRPRRGSDFLPRLQAHSRGQPSRASRSNRSSATSAADLPPASTARRATSR
jgi:uncharacterized protein YndB with AHSA1/START domain